MNISDHEKFADCRNNPRDFYGYPSCECKPGYYGDGKNFCLNVNEFELFEEEKKTNNESGLPFDQHNYTLPIPCNLDDENYFNRYEELVCIDKILHTGSASTFLSFLE